MTTVVDSAPVELAPIQMYPGYSAHEHGDVIGPRGKRLKPTSKGQICVSVGGVKRMVNVSELIWVAFNGELPEGGIEHYDGNPKNRELRNLVPAGGRQKPSSIAANAGNRCC
jgi:hypothetical protein